MQFITQEDELHMDLPLQALYFYTSYIPFHKKMLIMIDKIEKKYNIPFIAIDTDQFKNQCKRFSVVSLPTIIVFSGGTEIQRIDGIITKKLFNNIF